MGLLAAVVPAQVFSPWGLVGWNRCRPRHLIHQGAPRVMELNLHANATTTPKERAYIQRSKAPAAELAAELGVSETTIRRWRGRTTITDRTHRPKTLATSFFRQWRKRWSVNCAHGCNCHSTTSPK